MKMFHLLDTAPGSTVMELLSKSHDQSASLTHLLAEGKRLGDFYQDSRGGGLTRVYCTKGLGSAI